MKATVCSHCGAVFVSAADVSVCPHCGRNPQGSLWRRLTLLASGRFGVLWWIVWLVLWFQGRHFDFGQLGVFTVLLIGAALSILYFGRSSRGGRRPVTTLDLTPRAASTEAPENSWTPSPRPSVPPQWSPLISLPRPREVYWPFWSKVWTAADVAFIFASVGFFAFVVHGSLATFRHWAAAWKSNLPLFIITVAADLMAFAGIYQEFQNRRLLRDGEATIGTIVDRVEGQRRLSTTIYQFWTRSGERFEHRGLVRSDREEYSEAGPVPVFYLPEDPTRSLALCCTALRVRIPGEELAVRMQRIGSKS